MAGTEINNDPDGKKAAAEAESKARKDMLKSIPGMEVESALKRGLNHVITKNLPDEVNEDAYRLQKIIQANIIRKGRGILIPRPFRMPKISERFG